MNKARRKDIARAKEMIGKAKTILETAQSEEQDYFDNMPESLQTGEPGQKAEGNAEVLQEAVDDCDELIGKLDNAVE